MIELLLFEIVLRGRPGTKACFVWQGIARFIEFVAHLAAEARRVAAILQGIIAELGKPGDRVRSPEPDILLCGVEPDGVNTPDGGSRLI
jgi:hypothetical protein